MSTRRVSVVAHPNVALSKYWGKRARPGNFPAVPSLSVTLGGLATRTAVRFDPSLDADRLVLNGAVVEGEARARAAGLLERVRVAAGVRTFALVESTNDFPTASGLASSASGFAALALAATQAAALEWDDTRVSDLARRSSASAARSLFGGYVELEAGLLSDPADPDGVRILGARPIAPADQLPLVILVCVTSEGPKAVGSTDGMLRTLQSSPYAAAWLDEAPRLHARLRDALAARDFLEVGRLSEASALAMHASAIAAGVVYFSGATLEVLSAVRALREEGTPVFATIDAGPHVKVLVQPDDAEAARARLGGVRGVLRILVAQPGAGARVESRGADA